MESCYIVFPLYILLLKLMNAVSVTLNNIIVFLYAEVIYARALMKFEELKTKLYNTILAYVQHLLITRLTYTEHS